MLADGSLYVEQRKHDLQQLLQQQSECQRTLEQVEDEWLQLQAALDA